MAAAFARRAPMPARALVVGTHCPVALPSRYEWVEASHPVPDARSEAAARRALDLAAEVGDRDLLVVLLSGGASSLLSLPRDGITLADKQAATRQLLRSGADIHELNTVRKHLSAIKGGQLAAAARGRTLALAVSDVVSDDLSVIGSGPTVADPTTFGDALAVLRRRGGVERYPSAVVGLLEQGAAGGLPETPKPGATMLARAESRVIGSRADALAGAASQAAALGYEIVALPEPVVGEARDAGRALVALVASRARGGPLCVLAAGETTVTVTGSGRGGRNQELVLAAAAALAALGEPLAILSGGTDGIDGPTDAAGAFADETTIERASRAGLDAQRFLANNDAYNFFGALSDLVVTGPTDTNVGDVQVLLRP